MRVLLDASAIPESRGGVGRYVDELVPALVRHGTDIVVACQARDRQLFESTGADTVTVPAVVARRAVRLAWEQVGLPSVVRATGADVLHSPHYTMPRFSPVPVVVTLHDATFFSSPELHSRAKRAFFRAATRQAVRRAAALVVPSQATAREVARFAGAPRRDFFVAPHGVDRTTFHPVDEAERTRVAAALGLTGPGYVAFLGTLEPRKNVPALIRAWVQISRAMPHPPALVLAGARGWDATVDAAVASVPAHLQVVRPGYLAIGELPGLLSGATVVCYPSLGEGFGLPILEAMACGAVVLTTRELSLPEVGGDAVAYSGTSADEIADGLSSLLQDEARRKALSRAAVERAARFTWEAAAAVHLDAYAAALAPST